MSKIVGALLMLMLLQGAPTITNARASKMKSSLLSSLSRGGLSDSQVQSSSFPVDLMHIYHVDAPNAFPNLTLSKRIHLSIERDKERRNYLLQMHKIYGKNDTFGMENPEMQIRRLKCNYLVDFGLGEHSVPQITFMDTASQLTWVMCLPCHPCPTGPHAHHNHFDPTTSKSYGYVKADSNECRNFHHEGHTGKSDDEKEACTYSLRYGATELHTPTKGILSYENFTFKFNPDDEKRIMFGCSHYTVSDLLHDFDGILGLSRGDLSLVVQLNINVFSFCLVDFLHHPNKKGSLNFGKKSLKYQVTPLIPSELTKIAGYYLDLKGLLVNDELVYFPRGDFDVDPAIDDRRIDLLIDSGCDFSYWYTNMYVPFQEALIKHIAYPILPPSMHGHDNFELCYNIAGVENPQFPKVALRFQDMDLLLPQNNVFMQTVVGETTCLAIHREIGPHYILGATQLQNIDVLHNLGKNEMGFAYHEC